MSDPAGTLPSGVAVAPRQIAAREIDLEVRIRRNLVAGTAHRNVFGRALIDNGDWEQLAGWTAVASAQVDGSPAIFPRPADGPVSVVSDSALDTVDGTGAQAFEVLGVGEGGTGAASGAAAPWTIAAVPLAGTTPVQTTSVNFWGGAAECGMVTSAGSLFTNQGTITVSRVSDGKVLYEIPPRWGHTLTGRITVPLGWTAVIRRLILWWDGDTQAHWRLVEHNSEDVRFSKVGGSVQLENSGSGVNLGGFVIPSGSTFWFEGIRRSGGQVADTVLTVWASVEFYQG